MEPLLVLTQCPDDATAERMATALIDARLAACVSIQSPVRSVYRWQGVVESASEIPLLIKSTVAAYPALEKAILSLHPYQVPEIIALPITQGLPAYLNWVATETTQT